MRMFRKLNRQTADLKLRMIPELRPLSREQRWARWVGCYGLVASDHRIRSLRTVRDLCSVVGILAGVMLGFLGAGVSGAIIGLVAGALAGGAIGGLIHGVAFRRKARFYLRKSFGGC